MTTEVTFINENQVKVVTDRGEEIMGYLRRFPAKTKEQQQEVKEVIEKAFDMADNLMEAQNYVSVMACSLTMGMNFQYTVPPSEALRKKLGARLKEIREHRGMTARELSFITHIDPANLSRIEQGKHAVGIDTLFKILYYLDSEIQIVEKDIPEDKKSHRIMHFE